MQARIGRVLVPLACVVVGVVACSPTSPSCTDSIGRGETSFNNIGLVCTTDGANMRCAATASITGLYVYCRMTQDVTLAATWTSGDARIARALGNGVFEPAGIGDTTVAATWQGIKSSDNPVSVFPGSPPLPTFEILGAVTQAGQPLSTGGISGATIQIMDGIVAGRAVVSGGVGIYRLLAVPIGTYTVRASKSGYLSQDAIVTVIPLGGPSKNFELIPN